MFSGLTNLIFGSAKLENSDTTAVNPKLNKKYKKALKTIEDDGWIVVSNRNKKIAKDDYEFIEAANNEDEELQQIESMCSMDISGEFVSTDFNKKPLQPRTQSPFITDKVCPAPAPPPALATMSQLEAEGSWYVTPTSGGVSLATTRKPSDDDENNENCTPLLEANSSILLDGVGLLTTENSDSRLDRNNHLVSKLADAAVDPTVDSSKAMMTRAMVKANAEDYEVSLYCCWELEANFELPNLDLAKEMASACTHQIDPRSADNAEDNAERAARVQTASRADICFEQVFGRKPSSQQQKPERQQTKALRRNQLDRTNKAREVLGGGKHPHRKDRMKIPSGRNNSRRC